MRDDALNGDPIAKERYEKTLAKRREVLSGELNDVPSGRLFRADLGFLQMCQSL